MATSIARNPAGVHPEIKTCFTTNEGTYRNVKASEHCRPTRQPLFGKELSPVQISMVSCKDKDGLHEWIVFNSGKELYFYKFEGVGKVPDLKRPIDKRVYKAPTIPVCHDFNTMTRSTIHLDLVVGFSTGPLQYLNPLEKQAICAFNEDGSIDSTRVTCVRWVPGSEHSFVSSHRSGNLYVWTTENRASKGSQSSNIVLHKETLDAKIYINKLKSRLPLLFRWTVGHGPINAFAFSPDAMHIAISSQDGFLRIYDFHKQELYGRMRSYYGGLLCVCWSPDGKYAVTGGEDDLITVWSFEHKRVVARGEGHRSYVNAVAFDPYMTILPNSDVPKPSEKVGEDSSLVQTQAEVSSGLESDSRSAVDAGVSVTGKHLSEVKVTSESFTAYRLGSIGQDTQFCLWDFSGDSLKIRRLARGRSRMNRHSRPVSMAEPITDAVAQGSLIPKESVNAEEDELTLPQDGQSEDRTDRTVLPNHLDSNPNASLDLIDADRHSQLSITADQLRKESSPSVSVSSSSSASSKKEKKRKKDKKEKRPLKQHRTTLKEPMRKVIKFVGSGFTTSTPSNGHGRRAVGMFETCNSDDIAPKMHEVNLVEPMVAKKVSQERLTALIFREDCFLTACQEGFISTWARPNICMTVEEDTGCADQPASSNTGINSPKPGAAVNHNVPLKSTPM